MAVEQQDGLVHDDLLTWRVRKRYRMLGMRLSQRRCNTNTLRVYAGVDEGSAKEVSAELINDAWRLDYNTFKGPFPHQ